MKKYLEAYPPWGPNPLAPKQPPPAVTIDVTKTENGDSDE
jgi:hypothetical protein